LAGGLADHAALPREASRRRPRRRAEQAEPAKKASARTDAKGRVTLKLPRGGFWLVKAVHMEEAPKTSGFEWESWWASLTFEMP
jgi:uncharacterized GH25 family protein